MPRACLWKSALAFYTKQVSSSSSFPIAYTSFTYHFTFAFDTLLLNQYKLETYTLRKRQKNRRKSKKTYKYAHLMCRKLLFATEIPDIHIWEYANLKKGYRSKFLSYTPTFLSLRLLGWHYGLNFLEYLKKVGKIDSLSEKFSLELWRVYQAEVDKLSSVIINLYFSIENAIKVTQIFIRRRTERQWNYICFDNSRLDKELKNTKFVKLNFFHFEKCMSLSFVTLLQRIFFCVKVTKNMM